MYKDGQTAMRCAVRVTDGFTVATYEAQLEVVKVNYFKWTNRHLT